MRGKSYRIARGVALLLLLLAATSATGQEEITTFDPPTDYLVTGSIQLDSRTGGSAGALDALLGMTTSFELHLNDAILKRFFSPFGVGAGTSEYTFRTSDFDIQFSGPNAALLNNLVAPYLTGGLEADGALLRYDSLMGNLRLTMEAEWPCDVPLAGFAFTANNGVFNGVPDLGSHGFPPTTTIEIQLPSGIRYEGSLETQTPGQAFTISAVPEPALGGVMLVLGVCLLRRVRG